MKKIYPSFTSDGLLTFPNHITNGAKQTTGWTCLETLHRALHSGQPEVFNSGAQFTSQTFNGKLEVRRIRISMDGRGRVFDNIFIERRQRTRDDISVSPILDAPPIRAMRSNQEGTHLNNALFLVLTMGYTLSYKPKNKI